MTTPTIVTIHVDWFDPERHPDVYQCESYDLVSGVLALTRGGKMDVFVPLFQARSVRIS